MAHLAPQHLQRCCSCSGALQGPSSRGKVVVRASAISQSPAQRRCHAAESCSSPLPLLVPAPCRAASSFWVVLAPPQAHAHPRRGVACSASSPDTEEARSPLDAPQEWEPPQPSRRPDIFPEFEKMDKVFLPKPLPGDPEMPDEEMEEARKRTSPGDPDPEQKPGEPPEPEEAPAEPGSEPEKKGTDIPNQPE